MEVWVDGMVAEGMSVRLCLRSDLSFFTWMERCFDSKDLEGVVSV